jgi:transposase-like protein
MDNTKFLDTYELAERWGMHPQTLARWRRIESGPKFIKAQHPVRVLYPILEIESYERQNPFLKK